jgi:hypothetical protein
MSETHSGDEELETADADQVSETSTGDDRGRVPIAGWSYGGVGPEKGLRGGGRRGWCEEWARRG